MLLPVGPSIVGQGGDYRYAFAGPNTEIYEAKGSFLSVSDMKSETDICPTPTPPGCTGGADHWSLQINTNQFTVSNTYTDGKTAQGWEQFIYRNGDIASIEVWYWLLGYALPQNYGRCPSAKLPAELSLTYWALAQDSSGNCYTYGYAKAFTAPLPLASLGDLVLWGSSNFVENSVDEASVCTHTKCSWFDVSVPVLDLWQHWHLSEFNVYGEGDGSKAQFNNGALITISNAIWSWTNQMGAPITPVCKTSRAPNLSLTGESNNLQLGDLCSVKSNAIVFKEGNGQLVKVFVDYVIEGGSGTSQPPTFNYLSLGDQVAHTLSTSGDYLYLDAGTTWRVTNPLSCTSCDPATERWKSPLNQGAPGSFVDIKFFHQYRQVLTYAIIPFENAGSPPAPTWSAKQFGVSTTQALSYCAHIIYNLCYAPFSFWADNGSPWNVSPNRLIGSGFDEQWVTYDSLSGTVSSANSFYFKYQHQFLLTAGVFSSATSGSVTAASHWADYRSLQWVTAVPNSGYYFDHWATTGVTCFAPPILTPCVFYMPDNRVFVYALFSPTYSVTFKQVGIPSTVTWGVNVGQVHPYAHYTGTGSSITVTGLSGKLGFFFEYDTSVTDSSGRTYACVSGCSGYVNGPTTRTATYQVQLRVMLTNPLNNGIVTTFPVKLSGIVQGTASTAFQSVTVNVYLNGELLCAVTPNGLGQFVCSAGDLGPGSYTWYATATAPGYASGTSQTWVFILEQT